MAQAKTVTGLRSASLPLIGTRHGLTAIRLPTRRQRCRDYAAVAAKISVEKRAANPERIISAHDGIRSARFERLAGKLEARRQVGWDEAAFIVGYVGSLRMIGLDKGVGTLLRALANIDEAHLALVGGQTVDAQDLRQQWAELELPERTLPSR